MKHFDPLKMLTTLYNDWIKAGSTQSLVLTEMLTYMFSSSSVKKYNVYVID